MDVLGLGIQLCKRAKQLFIGLLDTYSGAAAAYSFRKLRRGFTGYPLRVRRDSDDVEVLVAFDSSNKVSGDSSVYNLEDYDFGTINFNDGWTAQSGSTIDGDLSMSITTGFPQSLGVTLPLPKDIPEGFYPAQVKATVSGTSTTSLMMSAIQNPQGNISTANKYKIPLVGGGNSIPAGTFSNQVFQGDIRFDTNFIAFNADFFGVGSFDFTSIEIELVYVDGGDTTDTNLSDFIDATTPKVVTWFDQTGNGVNLSFDRNFPDIQPELVTSGSSVLGLRLGDYDGNVHVLYGPADSLAQTSGELSFYSVINSSGQTTTAKPIFGISSESIFGGVFDMIEETNGDISFFDGTTTVTSTSALSSGSNAIVSADVVSNEVDIRINSTDVSPTTKTVSVASITDSLPKLGAGITGNGGVFWDGTVSELIYYNASKSGDRDNIERNIGKYWNIILPVVVASGLAFTVDYSASRVTDVGSQIQLYSSIDDTDNIYTRNTDLWLQGYERHLSALTVATEDQSPNLQMATAVTKRHLVSANHSGYYPSVGSKVYFVTHNNETIERTVIAEGRIGTTDAHMTLIDEDLPESIIPSKLFPDNYNDYLPGLSATSGVYEPRIPVVYTDQQRKLLVHDISHIYDFYESARYATPIDPDRLALHETLVAGDSGNPAWAVVNNELWLVSTWYGSYAGPFYGGLAADLNSKIAALDSSQGISTGYTVTEGDLSIFV